MQKKKREKRGGGTDCEICGVSREKRGEGMKRPILIL